MFGKLNKKISEKKLKKAVSDFQSGSAEAFHILYQEYNQKIYKFCLRLLNDEELARDAFQETFIKIYQKSNQFRGDNFQSWLFTIARNNCFNIMRSQREEEIFDESYHKPGNSKIRDIGMKDYIGKAIAKLPLLLREALILREYEEHSYKEIAEIMGVDLSLAKVRVHRARKMLKELLQPLMKEINEN